MSNPLANIHTLYIEQMNGESVFGQRLAQALKELGPFELIEDRAEADALVTIQGQDADDGFVGEMVIRDPRGTVLWSGRALRPHGEAGPMAYERLIEQLRRELA